MAKLTVNILFAEPDDDKKKKSSKMKVKSLTPKNSNDVKPNISYPTNFEHTVHVGFDAVTGEFTVNTNNLHSSSCVCL